MKIQIEELKGKSACTYCRKLMKEENFPEFLYIYRGDMLCLTVDVEKASKLRLDENTLRYVPYKNDDNLERLKQWKNRDVSGL